MNRFRRKTTIPLTGILVGCSMIIAQASWAQQASGDSARDGRTSDEQLETEDMPVFVSDSNTGYIDNAIIGTFFRVRFDAGFEVDSPDRSEFFYGACGCARDVPLPPANVPNPAGEVLNPDAPGPSGTVIPGAILTSPLIETQLDYRDIRFDFEYAFSRNFSLFAEIPVRQVDGETLGKETGLGDVRAGFKWGLIQDPGRHLTLQLRAYFPTGDAEKGLGTDHASLEPGLIYYGRHNERWTTAAELRYWIPIDGTTGRSTGFDEDYSGDVLRYGFGFGYDFPTAGGGTVTPVTELVGWYVVDGLALSSADGTPLGTTLPGFGYRQAEGENILNLKFGLRFGFRNAGSLFVGYGKALTDDVWYDDVLRIEYRSNFARR